MLLKTSSLHQSEKLPLQDEGNEQRALGCLSLQFLTILFAVQFSFTLWMHLNWLQHYLVYSILHLIFFLFLGHVLLFIFNCYSASSPLYLLESFLLGSCISKPYVRWLELQEMAKMYLFFSNKFSPLSKISDVQFWEKQKALCITYQPVTKQNKSFLLRP